MEIGETRTLKRFVLGIQVLEDEKPAECSCDWEEDDGKNVTLTLRDCPLHKPWPKDPPRKTKG